MNTLARFKSMVLKQGYRLLTMLEFGGKTAYQLAPFGDDSHPTENMIGVLLRTSESGENFVAGFMNVSQIAKVGEKRIFSVDSNGEVATQVYLKNNGVIVLGEESDYAVRYNELEKSYNALKSDLNSLVSKFNSHTHTTTATVGSSPAPGVISPTSNSASPSNASISAAKVEEIRVP